MALDIADEDIHFDYDGSYCLYISFGENVPAVATSEPEEGCIIRRDEETGRLVGITIIMPLVGATEWEPADDIELAIKPARIEGKCECGACTWESEMSRTLTVDEDGEYTPTYDYSWYLHCASNENLMNVFYCPYCGYRLGNDGYAYRGNFDIRIEGR